MRQLGGSWPCWVALLLGYLSPAAAADLPAPPLAALAHSALVTLEGAATPSGLILRVRPSAGEAPLAVTELSVSLDGRVQVAVRRADGSWFVALAPAAWRAHSALEVIVAHDGVREILDGHISAPQPAAPAGAAADLLHDHKQMVWWILNITIVLIAVIAVSRRMS